MAFITPISRNASNSETITSLEDARAALKSKSVVSITPVSPAPGGLEQVSAGASSPIAYNPSSIEKEISAFLAQSNWRSIKAMLPLLTEVSSTLRELAKTSNLEKNVTSHSPSIQNELREVFELLDRGGVTISEDLFRNPAQLTKFLQDFASPQMKETIERTQSKLSEIVAQLPPPFDYKILKGVFEALTDLTVSLSTKTIPEIKTDLATFSSALKNLFSENAPKLREESAKILSQILTALSELANKIEKHNPLKETARFLDNSLSLIRESTGNKDPKEVAHLYDAIRLVDQLTSFNEAQSNLAKLNTVMNALGEPSLFVFTVLIGGELSRIKFTHDSVGEDKKRKKGDAGYQQINLEVELSHLGAVQLQMAHTDTKVLIKLTVATQEVATFLESRISYLRESLDQAGYRLDEAQITTGKPESLEPSWVSSVLDTTEIIA